MNYREAERERIEQYEKELEEMKQRVEKRPLLVERQSQVGSKSTTDRRLGFLYTCIYVLAFIHCYYIHTYDHAIK